MLVQIQPASAKKHIEKINNKKALGHDATIDFNHGYLTSLLHNKIINRQQYNSLMKVYSNYQNCDYHWFINKKGEIEVDPEGEISQIQ